MRRRADLALVAAAFLFGSTFLVVQEAVEEADVVPFLAVRFLVGAALLAPAARRRQPTPGEWTHGVLAGLCLLAGFLLQTVGLQFTTSSSSAFITYLLVVFVPVISAVLTRTPPSALTVAGVVLAVVGLLLLSGGVSGFGRGEWLTLGCALAFAAHIMVLAKVASRHDPVRLTCWQILTVGLACLVPGMFLGGYGFEGDVWLAALFCGLGPTAAAFFCMVWAQRVVTPTRAALLLLLEPVFAAVLGYLAGERLGARGLAGATLILAAVVLAEVLPVAAERSRQASVDREVKLRAR